MSLWTFEKVILKFWSVWGSIICLFFCKLLSEDVKIIFWERKAKPSNEWMLWVFKKFFFWLFHTFLTEEVEFIFLKVRQNLQNCFNQKCATANIIENCFQTILGSIRNVLNIWKWCFLLLLKIFVDDVEAISWKRKVKPSTEN